MSISVSGDRDIIEWVSPDALASQTQPNSNYVNIQKTLHPVLLLYKTLNEKARPLKAI
jgi:hypothetical protein